MTKKGLIGIIEKENAGVLKKPCMKPDFHLPYEAWKKMLVEEIVARHPKQMHVFQIVCYASVYKAITTYTFSQYSYTLDDVSHS